jgi:hypothetical protein
MCSWYKAVYLRSKERHTIRRWKYQRSSWCREQRVGGTGRGRGRQAAGSAQGRSFRFVIRDPYEDTNLVTSQTGGCAFGANREPYIHLDYANVGINTSS